MSNTITIKDPNGNIVCSVESVTPVNENNISLESVLASIDNSTKSCENSYAECIKYINALEVMSVESSFGDKIKKVSEKIAEFLKKMFDKIVEYLKKFYEFILSIIDKVSNFFKSIKRKKITNDQKKLLEDVKNNLRNVTDDKLDELSRGNISGESFRSIEANGEFSKQRYQNTQIAEQNVYPYPAGPGSNYLLHSKPSSSIVENRLLAVFANFIIENKLAIADKDKSFCLMDAVNTNNSGSQVISMVETEYEKVSNDFKQLIEYFQKNSSYKFGSINAQAFKDKLYSYSSSNFTSLSKFALQLIDKYTDDQGIAYGDNTINKIKALSKSVKVNLDCANNFLKFINSPSTTLSSRNASGVSAELKEFVEINNFLQPMLAKSAKYMVNIERLYVQVDKYLGEV